MIGTLAELIGLPALLLHGFQGWREPGYFHTVVLESLQPGAHYWYRVGSNETGWSETYTFKAAISPEPKVHLATAIVRYKLLRELPYVFHMKCVHILRKSVFLDAY